jgi:hypothetical protein
MLGTVGKHTSLVIIGSFAILLAPFSVGIAQQWEGCENHAQMISKLTNKYHEERAAVATSHYGWLVELFMSADGKSWTFVETRPNGPACVAAEGTDWQVVQSTTGHPM